MNLEIIREYDDRPAEKMLICRQDLFLYTDIISTRDRFVASLRYDLMKSPFEFYFDEKDKGDIDDLIDTIKKGGNAVLKVKYNDNPPLGWHRGLKIAQYDFESFTRED